MMTFNQLSGSFQIKKMKIGQNAILLVSLILLSSVSCDTSNWGRSLTQPDVYVTDWWIYPTLANYKGTNVESFTITDESKTGLNNLTPWGVERPLYPRFPGVTSCTSTANSRTTGEFFVLCDQSKLFKVFVDLTNSNPIFSDPVVLTQQSGITCSSIRHATYIDAIIVICRENDDSINAPAPAIQIFAVDRSSMQLLDQITVTQQTTKDVGATFSTAVINQSDYAQVALISRDNSPFRGQLVNFKQDKKFELVGPLTFSNVPDVASTLSISSGPDNIYATSKVSVKHPITQEEIATDYISQICSINNDDAILTCGEKTVLYRDIDKEQIYIKVCENTNYYGEANVVIASDSFITAGSLSKLGYSPILGKVLTNGANKNIAQSYILGKNVYTFGKTGKPNWIMSLIDTRSSGMMTLEMSGVDWSIDLEVNFAFSYLDRNYARYIAVKDDVLYLYNVREPYLRGQNTKVPNLDTKLTANLAGGAKDVLSDSKIGGFVNIQDSSKILEMSESKQTAYTGSTANYWPTSSDFGQGNGAILSKTKGPNPTPTSSSGEFLVKLNDRMLKKTQQNNDVQPEILLTDSMKVNIILDQSMNTVTLSDNIKPLHKNIYIDGTFKDTLTLFQCEQGEQLDLAPTCRLLFKPIATNYPQDVSNTKVVTGWAITSKRVALVLSYQTAGASKTEVRIISQSDGTQAVYPLDKATDIIDFKEITENGVTKLIFYAYVSKSMSKSSKKSANQSFYPDYTNQGFLYSFEIDSLNPPNTGTQLTLNPVMIKGLRYLTFCGTHIEFFKSPVDHHFVFGSNCSYQSEESGPESYVQVMYVFKYQSFSQTSTVIADYFDYIFRPEYYNDFKFCVTNSHIIVWSESEDQSPVNILKQYSRVPDSEMWWNGYHHDIAAINDIALIRSVECQPWSDTFHVVAYSVDQTKAKKFKDDPPSVLNQYLITFDNRFVGVNNRRRLKSVIQVDKTLNNWVTSYSAKQDRLIKFSVQTSKNGNTFNALNVNMKSPKIRFDNQGQSSKTPVTQTFYYNDLFGFYTGSSITITNNYVDPILTSRITLIEKQKEIEVNANSKESQTFDLSTYFNFEGPIRSIKFLPSAGGADPGKNQIKQRQQSSSMKWGQITENLVAMRTDGDLLIGQTKD